MANSLNMELVGRAVIFRQSKLVVPATLHPFVVTGGYGSEPFTMGTALSGMFLSDGEVARMEGMAVERLATRAELEALDTMWSREYLERYEPPVEED